MTSGTRSRQERGTEQAKERDGAGRRETDRAEERDRPGKRETEGSLERETGQARERERDGASRFLIHLGDCQAEGRSITAPSATERGSEVQEGVEGE
jgi:hypothetical protein